MSASDVACRERCLGAVRLCDGADMVRAMPSSSDVLSVVKGSIVAVMGESVAAPSSAVAAEIGVTPCGPLAARFR